MRYESRKYVRGIVHKEEDPGLNLSKNIKVPTFFHMQTIEAALQAGKEIFQRGSFKNYVDKMRWVGGQKMLLFVHV